MASEKDFETPSGVMQSSDESDSTEVNSRDGQVNPEKPAQEEEEMKEGGYGWVIVAAVCLILAHSFGINSMFGVFLAFYLKSNTYPGATPLQFAFIGGLCFSVAFLVPPVCTMLHRKAGVQITIIVGGIFISGGYIAASFSKTIWQLILSQGVCYGIGMGICFTGTASLVPQWFKKRRSLANGIATGGTGLGGLTYSLAANAMIQRLGIAWTFRIMAIICFVVITISALFLKEHDKTPKAAVKILEWKFFKMLDFWLFLGWLWFASLGYVVVVFSLSAYAQQVGFSAQQGSLASAMFNLSTGIGRPLIGFACDRFGTIRVTMLGTFFSALITFFIWIFGGKSYGGLMVYALLGMFPSLLWASFVVMAVSIFGLKLTPAAISLSILTLALPYTFAEAIGLSLRKSGVDGFINVQVFAGVMFVAAGICTLILTIRKGELYRKRE
ncbi:MFS general substrate transporter [Trichoderma camerunense]